MRVLLATTSLARALTPGGDARQFLASTVAHVLEQRGITIEDPMVMPATKQEFGDYQCNVALALAKRLDTPPRVVADDIRAAIEPHVAPHMDLDVAGPGFINARLNDGFLGATVGAMARCERAATPYAATPSTVVVDYSSPNIAKEMHVGHLRSTVIGDCLANLQEHLGHSVTRLNHVGDWGTQFGMLIAHLDDREWSTLGDLVTLYKEAKARFDGDDDFKARARRRVVELQSGDVPTLRTWERICEASRVEFKTIYDRLDISNLTERGESFYNPLLGDVCARLERDGIAVESEGALVVFLDGAGGDDAPLIIRKSDGGYNYATTDLAAAMERGAYADRVLYVTDAGQASHFAAVFDVARRARLVPPHIELTHVPFGVVQGADGKKFKTRAGDTVKLKDLLDEAEARVAESRDVDADVARHVGIAAVKYADLALNRESNYRFSFDKMLALNGNTAPYMLYSYARIRGIQAGISSSAHLSNSTPPRFTEAEERTLARTLAKLPTTLAFVDTDLRPNILCDYLYDLAQVFNRFYEACPVRQAPTPDAAHTRALLCDATASALKLGLSILGISTLERL